jgi:hypothetical protein
VRACIVLESPADPKDPEGGSLRAHLEAVAKQGRRDKRLDDGEVPEGFEYLMDTFFRLRQGCASSMEGVRITWADVEAYKRATGCDLDAFEVNAIMEMDRAARETVAEMMKDRAKETGD